MDANLKIFGIQQSRASRCLRMARELGLSFENVPVHFNATRESAELMAVNPNGRVPAIDDNGFHLYESMAINLYLAKKYGNGSDIVPATLEDEARTLQWSFWVVTEIEQPLLVFLLHASGRHSVDEATLTDSRTKLDRPLTVLNAHLDTQDWLLGTRFTVADLNVASVLRWAKPASFDLSPYPNVEAWFGRCMLRPAFRD